MVKKFKKTSSRLVSSKIYILLKTVKIMYKLKRLKSIHNKKTYQTFRVDQPFLNDDTKNNLFTPHPLKSFIPT